MYPNITENATEQKTRSSVKRLILKWNGHQSNTCNMFEQLLHSEALTDVSIFCEGVSIKCHKIVLAACSPYFQTLFMENDVRNNYPVVIINNCKITDIKAIIEYMYKGKVVISSDRLQDVLQLADDLKVKGFKYGKESSKSPGPGPSRQVSSSSNSNRSLTNEVCTPSSSVEKPAESLPSTSSSSVQTHARKIKKVNQDRADNQHSENGGRGNNALTQQLQKEPRSEARRYKKYTQADFVSAVVAVQKGMSALQAARQFNIPSRTLYDRLKGQGIPTMGEWAQRVRQTDQDHAYNQGNFLFKDPNPRPVKRNRPILPKEKFFLNTDLDPYSTIKQGFTPRYMSLFSAIDNERERNQDQDTSSVVRKQSSSNPNSSYSRVVVGNQTVVEHDYRNQNVADPDGNLEVVVITLDDDDTDEEDRTSTKCQDQVSPITQINF